MSHTAKLKALLTTKLGTDANALRDSFARHLECSLAKDAYSATMLDIYKSLAYTVRDRMVKRWIDTQQSYYDNDVKRVYYLSMEFLMGRTLGNSLINLNLHGDVVQACFDLGYDLEELREVEWDAGLGNGGLGRLAACFLDSMATMELPAYGYGIRYEYGIFSQKIKDGYQVESPDNWLRYENPWEIARPEYLYTVQFYGRVHQYTDAGGKLCHEWVDTQDVMAMAYDTPIPGYRNNTVNNLRLWAAKSTREFDFSYFNEGNYIRAVENKQRSEIISKVLYPNDDKFEGKELRLKQEYFFVSATLQDVMRRFKKGHQDFSKFNDKVAVQLNDTHPAIAIPELMRMLIDVEHLEWEKAWEITVKTFGYTNHTILPEALEKWSVSLMERVLPRHIQIIYEINRRFLSEVAYRFPGSSEHQQAMSLIDENGGKKVCMAHLAIVGSHSTNGVAALHTELLKSHVFKPFYEMFPERFYNITNGITQRRWLQKCNPELAQFITKNIGDGWVKNLQELKKLIAFAEDKGFRDEWRKIKLSNKLRLAGYLMHDDTFAINVNAMFDCQVKRIHEYKRQLLNVLHVIYLYNKIRANPTAEYTPRSVIIGGKAAPGYVTAKLIIKLINSVADVVNNDPVIGGRLRLYFLANYRVSLAEKTIPATDLSEQISTAGTEASGTGNMKFALNGALTIGTLDGANIEIKNEVGDDNIFIFGMTVEEIKQLKNKGYRPYDYYQKNPELKEVLDMIGNGHFSPQHPYVFRPIVDSLLYQGDQYFLLADFASYVSCQERVSRLYRDREEWTKKSILNVARIGVFSSDRSIQEYAQKVWSVSASPVILTP